MIPSASASKCTYSTNCCEPLQ